MKLDVQSFLTENYKVDEKVLNKDRADWLVVRSSLSATDKVDASKLTYTINFYNITSRILVNKLRNVDLFLEHYENILAALSKDEELIMRI